MRATLEFELPEEDESFQDAINGTKWRNLIHDFDQYLRSKEKHGESPESEYAGKFREEFYRLMGEYDLSFN